MKTDVQTSIALLLLAVSASAAAQGPLTPQPDAQPPQPNAPPQTAPPAAPGAPPPQTIAPVQQAPVPVQPSAPPIPQQQQQPVAPAPPASSVPQSPPPPSYPPSQKYPSSQQSPPPQQYPTPAPATTTPPPPPRQHNQPQWVHSESTYSDSDSNGNANGFRYHPFRFHVDGGGTVTQRQSENYYRNGWNVGAGFTWYPTSQIPLGLRVEGTYNEFGLRNQLLQQASQSFMTPVDHGTQKMWGGDTDLELDLHFSPYVRAYLLAGGGWYRQQTTFRQTNYTPGFGCNWWGCGPAYFGSTNLVARNETGWHFAPNAGLGLEFAMSPRASFFVEARYMRLYPTNLKWDYIPIKVGLRF